MSSILNWLGELLGIFGWRKGPTETKIKHLLNLSVHTASKAPEKPLPVKELVKRCVEKTTAAHTYCSRIIMKDTTKKNLKPWDWDYLAQWRVDFAHSPDRYHVTQSAREPDLGEVFDEWVSIGKKHWQNSGLWYRDHDTGSIREKGELNRSLSVENLLAILRSKEPISSHVYFYRETHYLLLEYDAPESSGYGLFGSCASLLNSHGEMFIWIDLDIGLLAKGELVFEGQEEAGEYVRYAVQQVFTSYNENVEVRPPNWLNAAPNAEGELVIQETKIDILPHHN